MADDLYYSTEHLWVRVDPNGLATIGITEFAANQLGDIVYVQLPGVGATLAQGEEFGAIESVKTVSDLYAPISGAVVELNAVVADRPETVNQSPYDAGWLCRLRIADSHEADNLHRRAAYEKLIGQS